MSQLLQIEKNTVPPTPVLESRQVLLKRLDFRFLLATQQLDSAGYFGPTNGPLYAALSHFCGTLRLLPERSSCHKVPLVVMRNPRPSDIDAVAPFLECGGTIYAEIERPFQAELTSDFSVVAWHLRPLSSYVVRLRRLGFGSVGAFWHRPDFDHCVEIVPLSSEQALHYVLNRSTDSLRRKIQVSVGRFALRSGSLCQLVPCFSLISVRP